MAKGVFIKTYGCQMNVYDSARMIELLEPFGFLPVMTPNEADLVILNTCHVRERAAEKIYSELGKIHRLKIAKERGGGTMILAVGGCVALDRGVAELPVYKNCALQFSEPAKEWPLGDLCFGNKRTGYKRTKDRDVRIGYVIGRKQYGSLIGRRSDQMNAKPEQSTTPTVIKGR